MAIILGKPIVGRKETLLYANQKFNWNDDYIIGISAYYAFFAWLLAKVMGKKCIYYCIDYYTYRVKNGFWDGVFIWLAQKLDLFLCHKVDLVWDISDRINRGRLECQNFLKLNHQIMPLAYPPNYFRYNKPIYKKAVFTGLVPYGKEVWPRRTEWVGQGELELELLLDEISRYAVGISVWDREGNNYYGDPGKTKLYTACGLPVIMTDNTPFAKIIQETGAGEVVEYDKRAIERAFRRIISNYPKYKSKVKKTWRFINADKLLGNIKILER